MQKAHPVLLLKQYAKTSYYFLAQVNSLLLKRQTFVMKA